MEKRVLSLVAAGAVLFAGAECADVKSGQPFTLVGENASAEVVMPVECEPTSRLASREITNYVFKATGRLLPVRTADVCCKTDGNNAGQLVIGTIATLKEVPPGVKEKLLAMKQRDASWTGVHGGRLWIVGRDAAAELYAAYHFLETELGVRWFQAPTAEDPGEYVPKAATLAFAPFSRYREPAFEIRRLDLTGSAYRPIPTNGMATAVRNGFQVHPPYGFAVDFDKYDPNWHFYVERMSRSMQALGGGHLTFVRPMPGKTTFPEHPELFALVDGKRVQGSTHMEQYCLSNPEVRRRTVEDIIKHLEANGGKGQYTFGQVDTPHGYCHCENCMALDGPKEKASGGYSRTTRFIKTINDIAARVWEKYPNADLRTWAYLDYRTLPDGVVPDPRFRLYFCTHGRCFGHNFDDPSCQRNADIFKLVNGWRKLLPRIHFYDYLTCTPQYYACSEARETHDIRLYRKMGVTGWKNEASFSGSKPLKPNPNRQHAFPSNWQWLYLTGKLLWDPDLDENAVLDDAESKYYGPAYPAMREYQALRRKIWNEHPNHLGYPTGDQRRAVLLDRPGAKEKLLSLLDEAEKLAAGDKIALYRVRRDRQWLDMFWIKPNDEVKARRSLVLHIPERKGDIVLDGVGGDPAWGGAVYVDAFREMGKRMKGEQMPSAISTSVGMLYDNDYIYFLVDAKEPSPARMKALTGPTANVWDDDAIEFFIFPPTIENRCYHLAVNSKGAIWGGTNPGGRVANAFGAEAAVKVLADRYVIELRVPAKNVAPIRKGESWRVMVGRNRTVGDEYTPKAKPGGAAHFSIDGVTYSDTLAYRSVEFGGAYLRNGAFAELDEKGKPKAWGLPNGCVKIENTAEGHIVHLTKGQRIQQTMWHGALKQAERPRSMRFTFKASGTATVHVYFYRYRDTSDDTAPHGYRRKQITPSGLGGKFKLSDEVKEYTGEYEIPAGEWCQIALVAYDGDAAIRSVVVDPLNGAL